MPGTLLLDDWRQAVEDQLTQHARQAFQIVGNPPAAPDPQQVLNELQSHAAQAAQQAQQGVVQFAQQRQQDAAAVGQQLQDYAQQASQGVNQFNQPPLAGASPQPPASTVTTGVTPFEQPPPQPAPIATPAATGADVNGPPSTDTTVTRVGQGQSAFINSLQPLAARVAARTGIDPNVMLAIAANETGWGQSQTAKEQNNLFSIGGPSGQASRWATYSSPEQSFDAFVDLISSAPRYRQAWADRGDPQKFVDDLRNAGYVADEPGYPAQGWVDQVKAIHRNLPPATGASVVDRVTGLVQQGAGAVQQGIRDISQFGDAQLTNSEAYAACGPAAAVRFAERFGRNPTLREAVDLAKQVGWTEASGMAGIGSEQRLLEKLGVPTSIVQGAQWDRFAKEAQTGNPVTISTPGHYFYADGYDPSSGAFHVGRSGTDLRGGKEWMTPADMESRMGAVQGALLADNPTVPSKSSSPTYDVGGTRPAPRAPIYAGVMQPAGGQEAPFQVIGDTVGPVAQDLKQAAGQAGEAVGGALGAAGEAIGGALGSAGQAIGGAISDVGSGAQQTATDLGSSRAADLALRQGRTQREAAELQLRMQEDRGVTDRSLLSALDEARSLILQSNKDTLPDALSRAGEILGMTDLGRAVAANQANPPLMGVREQIANAPVVGGALGMLRGPELLTDQEVLRSREADLARPILERFRQAEEAKGQAAPPVSDDEVIRAARSLMTGQAIAMTGEGFGHPGRGAADAELQAARQAVDDLRSRFPQMSPGSLAASREGRALAELESARSRPSPAAEPASAPLEQTLRRLDAYTEETARPVRDWATTTNATPSEVARTVDQWIAENPPSSLTAAEVSARPAPTDAGFRAPTMGDRPVSTVGGTRPLTVSSGAQPLRINAPRGSLASRPGGTSADRLDYLLDRGRYAPPPEAPIPPSPASALRPLATTVAGEAPLNVAGPSSIDISPSGRRLTEAPSGTTADRLDQLLERGRYAPPGERPTPSALERANTVRLAGLLSSTTTHLVNATGNLVNGATAIPQQVIASGFDAARVGLGGGTRQRYLGEVLPMIKSWGPGVINSVPDALEILRTGVSPQDAGKLDHIGAGFRSDLLPVVGRMLGKKGGAIADSVIEMPLRMLQASDVLFRGGATNAFTNGLAVRKALQEGFKRGPALERRVATIMSTLDQHPELVKEANEQAARVVFQENREVPFVGRQVGRALEGSGVLRFAESQVLPFTKTPYNITAQGAGLSPLGWASVAQAARSGNPGLALDRAARASIGTAAFGVAMWMGSHGLLTGAYPDDPQVRSTLPNGWREWSVRLPQSDGGAVYVPMQNFGAYGWPLAMASIATEAASQGKSTADPDQIAKAVTSMGRYVLDNTFLQGLSDATNALHDPERYGQKLLESEASSFAPYSAMGRELQRISGMVNRNPRDGMQGIIDAMAATNPLTAGSVPERTNALGDPVSPTVTGLAAGVLPLRAEVEQDDPTLKVLRDNGVGVSTIAKAINVPSGSVSLTEQEQEEFKKARGELIKRYVASETRGADFAKGSLTARNKYLSDAVQRANRDARETMITKWAADRGAWRARIEKKAVPEPYYLGGTEGG